MEEVVTVITTSFPLEFPLFGGGNVFVVVVVVVVVVDVVVSVVVGAGRS